jgi:eukaryotic-like serine/threonine-protein kinase
MTDRSSLRGRTLRMVRAGRPVFVAERLGEGGQGVVHAARIGGPAMGAASYAVKWYRAVPKPVELRDAITDLIDSGCPHPAFIWPIDLVVSDEMPGFGYIMPRLEPVFSSLGELLDRIDQPPFRIMINIGRHLVAAFQALHGSGLCYRDINSKNLFVNTKKAEVAIIDNDNVGIDDAEVFVWGTLTFMAPEVVRREKFPSSHTDLHSLAVLLYFLFVHGHPLEGVKTDAAYSWGMSAESESQVAMRAFGLEPVFVFDPNDRSNRPRPGDPMLTWWPIYPRFFQELFEQSFTAGLSNPLTGRVPEGIWRRALIRLSDCVSRCSCTASVFYDPDNPELRCWHCGKVPVRPPLFQLPGGKLVLSEGAVITSHHLHKDWNYESVLGVVEAHPGKPGDVVLRNVSSDDWTMTPDGEAEIKVAPQRRLGVRPMVIDFGSVQGRIRID